MNNFLNLDKECFEIAMRAYLSEVPENWTDLSDKEQYCYIKHYKLDPLKDPNSDRIPYLFEDVVSDIDDLLKKLLFLESIYDVPEQSSFLVNLRIVHGQYNEYIPCIIQANEASEAGKKAILKHRQCDAPGLNWHGDRLAYDCCGDIGLTVDSITLIPYEHASLLMHYIK